MSALLTVDLTRLSRTVAHALRHQPTDYNLHPDAEGWVPVEDLLVALRNRRSAWQHLTLEDLARMIAGSEKRRYEMRDSRIRALYGHSLAGKVQRESAEPPETLYHGTSVRALEAIRSQGLQPMRRQYVHLSPDPATAQEVGARKRGETVVLTVLAGDAFRDGVRFYYGNDKVWLADEIPARYLVGAANQQQGEKVMTATGSIEALIEDVRDEMIATRRQIHREPELSLQEVKTAALIAGRLHTIDGVDAIHEGVGGTGVTALIHGAHPGSVLLLRADIDALPIQEATGASYASTRDGVMHACGHDGHTAILLAVARVLAAQRRHIHGAAFLVFQPAEEVGTGAQAMIDDGLWELAEAPVSAAIGLHLANDLPAGTVAVRTGPSMAAVDTFEITITGRGGHGAMPHLSVDPVVTGAELVLALQRIVSRELSALTPAVLSVGQFQAGTAPNIIPEVAWLSGTVRTYTADVRTAVREKIERIAAGVAAAGEAQSRVVFKEGVPSVSNDAAMCDLVRAVAADIVGPERVIEPPLILASDDVALFLERVPGCYFNVGSADAARGLAAPHHHPRFDIAEEALTIGARVMAESALRYLSASQS